MARTKKMACHDCGTVFNRKPQNGDKQVCWNCSSYNVTLLTDKGPPPGPAKGSPAPSIPAIPQAPSAAGLKMPTFAGGSGGGITADMLQARIKQGLKKVVRPPVALPGPKNSPIPYGVRLIAHSVRNGLLQCANMEIEAPWKEKGSNVQRFAYYKLPSVDVSGALNSIARGATNPEHSNFNDEYGNKSFHLPTRKGPRDVAVLEGITYYEYGWKRQMAANTQWYSYKNNLPTKYSAADNDGVNSFLKNLRQGKVFSERLVIAETGEVFYTPDHYATFFRYHPGTMLWFQYRSAGGSFGPQWDESAYDPPHGA